MICQIGGQREFYHFELVEKDSSNIPNDHEDPSSSKSDIFLSDPCVSR